MKQHKPFKKLIGAAAAALLVAAPAWSDHHEKDIVDTAVSAGQFETLVAAVKAAGLVDALKGEGPYTVFAPTDEAFAKLPEGTVEALLNNIPKLKNILLYHVVPAKVMAADAMKADSAPTLFGQDLTIEAGEGVTVSGASVVKADIVASNGVIHVVDTVMMPKTIAELAIANDDFSTLVTAVVTAGLAETLSGDGPFTVFAPTNDAFAALPAGTVESLLEPVNKEKLTSILTYHVVPGRVLASDVVALKEAKTVNGDTIDITVTKDGEGNVSGVSVDGARVVATDIVGLNGVIHVIDAVIMPGH